MVFMSKIAVALNMSSRSLKERGSLGKTLFSGVNPHGFYVQNCCRLEYEVLQSEEKRLTWQNIFPGVKPHGFYVPNSTKSTFLSTQRLPADVYTGKIYINVPKSHYNIFNKATWYIHVQALYVTAYKVTLC
jgi:hypothetical protein